MFYVVFCCATDNLFSISAPYIIAGRMHWLKIFLFNLIGSVPFTIVLFLPNGYIRIIGHAERVIDIYDDGRFINFINYIYDESY